jgi:AmmeMemoRadiSam system protein A
MEHLPSSKPVSTVLDQDGRRLAQLARAAIAEVLGGPVCQGITTSDFDGPLDSPGMSFVTLTLDGRLRGCIGSLSPSESLVEGILDHARAAAFQDTRFDPVRQDELERLAVEVSLLSPLRVLTCSSEEDLLRQLRPGVDGLVLDLDGRRALFLPQVWKELPEPRAFLAALKRKAGWPAGSWSSRTRAWTFTVEAWCDEPLPVHAHGS